MQINNSVRAVERILSEVDRATGTFLGKVSLKCPVGCAKCCHGQQVSASPIEFLPYAYHLYETGTLEDRYWEFKTNTKTSCLLVEGNNDGSNGRCSTYAYRGVICRLFGNAAMINKEGKKSYSGCSILKSQIAAQPQFESQLQLSAPIYSDFYMKLRNIDNTNGALIVPINIAIVKSMEIVYNNTRRKRKKIS